MTTATRLLALLPPLAIGIVSRPVHAEPVPELAPDPEVVETLEGLAPGESVRLPDFSVIGDGLDAFENFATRGPGVRDFCDKWVWADDRGRALYAGGNHGVPHKFNDLWEYDLESNTWVMLHAPDPDVSPSHTWWGLTYDQARSTVLWMAPSSPGTWDLGGYEGPPLQAYDTQAQMGWALVMSKPHIRVSLGAALEYIPNRDVVLFHSNQWNGSGLQQLDLDTRVWTELIPQDELYFDNPDAPPSEAIITYNAGHDVLVGFLGRAVYVYEFDANRWIRVLDEAVDEDFHVSDSMSGSDYDPYSDLHFVLTGGRLFAYDVASNAITDLEVELVPDFGMLYVDRDFGVVVMYDETSSHVVYRHGELPDPESTGEGSGTGDDAASTGDASPPDEPQPEPTTGGTDEGPAPPSGETTSGADASEPAGDSAGCGCRTTPNRHGVAWSTLFAIVLAIGRRRSFPGASPKPSADRAR